MSYLAGIVVGLQRAIVTYSRMPLKIDWQQAEPRVPSVAFLPWVGLLVGLFSAWPLLLVSVLMPNADASIIALLMLLTAVLLTGAFHEDGLMDTADGLFGGWDIKQRLSIMKDSHIGSYAALAIWFTLTLKWLLLSQLIESGVNTAMLVGYWCLMHSLARLVPLIIMSCLKYCSAGKSKAATMIAGLTLESFFWALIPSVLLSVYLLGVLTAAVLATSLLLFALLFGRYLYHKLGGFNGDTLGASEQMAELIILFSYLSISLS